MATPQSYAIGIDLGTTYSCVAVLRDPTKPPEVILNSVGEKTTPSYVAYNFDTANTEIYAGREAKYLACVNPENTIFDTKRLIGRTFYDENIDNFKEVWPFHLVNMTGLVGVKLNNKDVLFHEIAKELVSYMKKFAEQFLGCSINAAVVTIPVYYTELQEGLTKGACEAVGFTSLRFIPEPVAAAFAYGLESSIESHEKKTCLIFDLGGGTFDITVFELEQNNQVKIKGTGGDGTLGGEDFNDLLIKYCIQEFKNSNDGIDLKEGKTSDDAKVRKSTAIKLQRLRIECERQKCFLSTARSVYVELDSIHDNKSLNVRVTRDKFENMIDPFLEKCKRILDETLTEYGFTKDTIDEIILIGGSCRIPKVHNMVQKYFEGKRLLKSINPDIAVAQGASIHAYNAFEDRGRELSIKKLKQKSNYMRE